MDEPKKHDEQLMLDVAKGKREALEILIRRHATPLLTFIERMVGDRGLSEELFQDVFLAVWTKAYLYDYPRRFKNWLYAIAVNKCRSAQRRTRAAQVTMDDSAVVALEGTPEESAIAVETATMVNHAVTLLPPQQRAVVVLRVWQQLSYGEIADLLETTEATARSHMHHGLSALRKYLEPRLS